MCLLTCLPKLLWPMTISQSFLIFHDLDWLSILQNVPPVQVCLLFLLWLEWNYGSLKRIITKGKCPSCHILGVCNIHMTSLVILTFITWLQ